MPHSTMSRDYKGGLLPVEFKRKGADLLGVCEGGTVSGNKLFDKASCTSLE